MMLNAVNQKRMKFIDYKSIALPAELQGHPVFFYNIFITNQEFFLPCLYEKKLLMHY